jgi:hypothetical protein
MAVWIRYEKKRDFSPFHEGLRVHATLQRRFFITKARLQPGKLMRIESIESYRHAIETRRPGAGALQRCDMVGKNYAALLRKMDRQEEPKATNTGFARKMKYG